ncbi:MAG TPA: hypothetical protein VJT75_14050 [Thermoleophilaceae bacterium]|nr:hypothetical protein [Thermoleophilaceae bacterium]
MRRALLVLTVLALALAPSAGAAVRHAVPGGATSGDCKATACDFPTAVKSAQAGDEVDVAPGAYGSESSPIPAVTNARAIRVHGRAGKPRPRIVAEPAAPDYWGLGLFNPGASVAHLQITAVGNGSGASALGLSAARGDDLVVHSKVPTPGYAACSLYGGAVLTNSVCWAPAIQNASLGVGVGPRNPSPNATITLRNVTVASLGFSYALYAATASGQAVTVRAVNSVFKATYAVGLASEDGGGTLTFEPTYSNVVGQHDVEAGCCSEKPSSTNLSAGVLFVDPAGDFHQTPMSPTVNRGVNDPANGARDVDGQPRKIGGRTDIGADELLFPPLASTGPATKVRPRTAVLNGQGNPRGMGGTSAYFQLGRTQAYGLTTSTVSLPRSSAAQPVSRSPGGLRPATRYHYRLVVSGPGGVGRGGDRTFVTKAAPAARGR